MSVKPYKSLVVFQADGTAVPCCTDGGQFLAENDLSHGKCIPIEIPKDDPFYSRFRQRCMQFARSAPACRTDGRLGHVEQVSRFCCVDDGTLRKVANVFPLSR